MVRIATSAALMALFFGAAATAQEVPVETATLGKSAITLYAHPFLTEEELATLRLVMTNTEMLGMFLPGKEGSYAAMAVAPGEGFIRDGAPVASASALADLPDAATASANALQACNAARAKGADCVVVLEVGPTK